MALLEIPLKTMWSEVLEVRDRLETLLAGLPETVRAASVMVASELIENAIKYGEPVAGAPHSTVSLDHDGQQIRIVVRNGVASEATVRELFHHVDRVTRAVDKKALYFERLRDLMLKAGGPTQLGLYRIAHEGQFDISCDYSERVVTVTAFRRLA